MRTTHISRAIARRPPQIARPRDGVDARGDARVLSGRGDEVLEVPRRTSGSLHSDSSGGWPGFLRRTSERDCSTSCWQVCATVKAPLSAGAEERLLRRLVDDVQQLDGYSARDEVMTRSPSSHPESSTCSVS